MPNMPDKPDTWAIALAWLSQHSPILYAAGLSCTMAVLRITYGGGTRRQMLVEGAICGGLSLTIISGLDQQTGWGKAGYMASLFATTTVLGAVAMQLNEIASGRDPKNMLDDGLGGVLGLRFGMAAMLKGGALSLYGDFLFSNTTQGGTSALAAFGGPLAGDVETLFNLRGQTANAVEKEDASTVGASLVRLAKGHIPAANLWYTKAATDHLIFHQLQEYFSPGYLSRMQCRAQREFGQSYWWEPGEVSPSRSPAMGASLGD